MTDDKANERSQLWSNELDASDTSDEADTTDAMDTQGPWDVDSIRDEWHGNTVRLPDSLQRRWKSYYSRCDFELTSNGVDRDFGKDRHYKPLVIALGLRELDTMDADDIVNALDTLERVGHLDD